MEKNESYSSFELPVFSELLNERHRDFENLESADAYLAHKDGVWSEIETLYEHSELVFSVFLKKVGHHHLDQIADTIIQNWLEDNEIGDNIKAGLLIKKGFAQAIWEHDFGKINPLFQQFRMGNDNVSGEDRENGTEHALQGGWIFLNRFVKQILDEDLNSSAKNACFLAGLILAHVIRKHHAAGLAEAENFKTEDNRYEVIAWYLKKFHSYYDKVYNNLFPGIQEKQFQKIIDRVDCNDALFILSRLCFSLLTAADYQATLYYQKGIELNNKDTFDPDEKKEIKKNFRDSKKHNRVLLVETDRLAQVPFEELQERSNANLNKLRQKLAAKALQRISTDTEDQKLYYLEAPTGAGKTNTSFALVAELLNSDSSLQKVYYVFPFTTLVDQTVRSLKSTLGIDENKIGVLHSKTELSADEQDEHDAVYGSRKTDFLHQLFVHYPCVLTTQIKFFDWLKSESKESTYGLHRLANSVVVIDELQAYPPEHWSKIIFMLNRYAELFNLKIILMSATLPKLDRLEIGEELAGKVNHLITPEEKKAFFTNPNFAGRVKFSGELLGDSDRDQEISKDELWKQVQTKSQQYAQDNNGNVKSIIEFINKQHATDFKNYIESQEITEFFDEIILISGTIVQPKREEALNTIEQWKEGKLLVITTQVIEAGVDIDMDIGFKDLSLLDSDEQLAGRINREAQKENSVLYLFKYSQAHHIYGQDERYQYARHKMSKQQRTEILKTKNFDRLYDNVIKELNQKNRIGLKSQLHSYLDTTIRTLNFRKADNRFKLIDQQSVPVFVPLPETVPAEYFSQSTLRFLQNYDPDLPGPGDEKGQKVSGEKVFNIFERLSSEKPDKEFLQHKADMRLMNSVLNAFMFTVPYKSKLYNEIKHLINPEYLDRFGILYFQEWEKVYNPETGLNFENVEVMTELCML